MSDQEQVTVSLPSELAASVRSAVAGGDYASSSEVISEALRDWNMKRGHDAAASLKADIDRGLTDLADGRVRVFDPARIVELGRARLSGR